TMAIELVYASTAGAMKTRAQPQSPDLCWRSIIDAPGAAMWIDAGVQWRQSTKEQMRAHGKKRALILGDGTSSERKQSACRHSARLLIERRKQLLSELTKGLRVP